MKQKFLILAALVAVSGRAAAEERRAHFEFAAAFGLAAPIVGDWHPEDVGLILELAPGAAFPLSKSWEGAVTVGGAIKSPASLGHLAFGPVANLAFLWRLWRFGVGPAVKFGISFDSHGWEDVEAAAGLALKVRCGARWDVGLFAGGRGEVKERGEIGGGLLALVEFSFH